jgi:hypothetical protein
LEFGRCGEAIGISNATPAVLGWHAALDMDGNAVSRAHSACSWLVTPLTLLAPAAALASFSDPFFQSSFG